jgi:hypothetical protein
MLRQNVPSCSIQMAKIKGVFPLHDPVGDMAIFLIESILTAVNINVF